MNLVVRTVLYVVLSILAIWLGIGFMGAYRGMSGEQKAPAPTPPTNSVPSTPTEVVTNAADTVSNAVAVVTNGLTEATNTATAASTNSPATNGTAAAVATNTPTSPHPTAVAADDDGTSQLNSSSGAGLRAKNSGPMIRYLLGLVLTLIALGLLIARDLSKTVGGQAIDFLFNDDAVGIARPEYDAAEQVWASGDFLEAIRLLREYYQANPREIFVAVRIAEIYEKDLKNFLAAALEYEEILSKPLPAARWSWTAIHLCNIYSKMGQSDKSLTLLRRIAVEYGETPGAEKARKRLSQIDPVFLATLTKETISAENKDRESSKSAKATKPPKDQPPQSDMPTGFRPKK